MNKFPIGQLTCGAAETNPRVLVVHSTRATTIGDMLGSETPTIPRCVVHRATTAETGLLVAKTQVPFDVAVVEASLPTAGQAATKGGLALLRQLLLLQPELEVIVVADSEDAALADEAMAAGAFDCWASRGHTWRTLRLKVRQAAGRKWDRERLARLTEQTRLLRDLDLILHNLNAPHAIISGQTDLLAAKNPHLADDLGRIIAQTDRAVAMVRSLRAALGDAPVRICLRAVDFSRLWADWEPCFRAICARRAVRFDSDIRFTGKIEVDAHAFRQAVEQLVINGVESVHRSSTGTSSRGTVVVRACPTPAAGFRLAVEDDGGGFDTAKRDRMRRGLDLQDCHGTGLGLRFVASIAKQHAAEFEIESEPGRRTVFALKLPSRGFPLADQIAA